MVKREETETLVKVSSKNYIEGIDMEDPMCKAGQVRLELDATAGFQLKGGLLGDKVGFGKTLTTIGLIASRESAKMPPIPEQYKNQFWHAPKTTLIFVPSNLIAQWESEIRKFLPQKKWKILRIENITSLRKQSVNKIKEFDIILCTYRIAYSPGYEDRWKELCNQSGEIVSHEDKQVTKRVFKGHDRITKTRTRTVFERKAFYGGAEPYSRYQRVAVRVPDGFFGMQFGGRVQLQMQEKPLIRWEETSRQVEEQYVDLMPKWEDVTNTVRKEKKGAKEKLSKVK